MWRGLAYVLSSKQFYTSSIFFNNAANIFKFFNIFKGLIYFLFCLVAYIYK